MTEEELVRFVREEGIGAMTRMVARAYRFADALRAAGVPVVIVGIGSGLRPPSEIFNLRRSV